MEQEPTYRTATSRVWVVQTGESSGGAVHEQIVEHQPDSPFPPVHYHPDQDEYFEVEQGEMLFVVDGTEHLVAAGGSITVPRRALHRARNPSPERPARVRWETRPALRTTEFFAAAAALGDDGGLLDRARLAHEFRSVFRLPAPVGLVVPVLAGLGRLVGGARQGTGRRR